MGFELQHVLICRTDNIGDVVLTLPLAGYLKQQYPDIRIGFLCRRYAASVARLCTAVDYVVEYESFGSPSTTLISNSQAWMRQQRIDTIIFAKPDRTLSLAAKQAGISNRVGSSHRLWHWWTCNRLAHFSRVKSSLHEAQLNFALLNPLGINLSPALPDITGWYRIKPPAGVGHADKAVDGAEGNRLGQRAFKLIAHPKSNGNGREWPIGHYTMLARLLANHSCIQIYLTGSEAEGLWLQQNAPALLEQPNVRNLCGQLDLIQLCQTIQAADGLIASGTGPVHIAAASGQRTLGLYPPCKPIHPGRWAPVGKRAQTLCQENECRGCSDPNDCACMRHIRPEWVAEIVLQWMAETSI